MAPAIALRPPEEFLAIVDETRDFRLDVGVQALLDEHLGVAGVGIDDAHVQLVHVAADAREIDLVGSVGEPCLFRAVRILLPEKRRNAGSRNRHAFVFPGVGFHLHACLGVAVKSKNLFLRHICFARHRIVIGQERRARSWQGC